ncbi:MAG TPA: hypothetical protein VLS87_05645 [Woeseiaceae bacterium]|nr:hypothetical protein [Woeseiaceae bacterium]
MRFVTVLAGVLAFAATAQAAAEEPQLDPFTGLRMTGDWQLVRNNCVGCHSAKLITQQSGTEAHWLELIRWMQAKQNLWQFEPETEKKIIAYLAANYPPQENRRRAPIPPDLMPPNPYAPSLQDGE